MNTDTRVFQTILKDSYGIDAAPVDGAELSDLSSVRVYETYPGNYRTENYGRFILQKFQDEKGMYYNLVYCEQNFPIHPKLMAGMEHIEVVSFKRYELIKQVRPVKNYFLFRLIPHTVKGTPAW